MESYLFVTISRNDYVLLRAIFSNIGGWFHKILQACNVEGTKKPQQFSVWFEGNKAEKSRTSSSIKALFMCLHAAWMRIILLSTCFMYGYQPTENSLPFFSSHPIHSLTSSHQLQFDSVHCSLFEKSNFSSTTTNLFNLIQVRQISTTFLVNKTH